jgi:hypothetical protein
LSPPDADGVSRYLAFAYVGFERNGAKSHVLRIDQFSTDEHDRPTVVRERVPRAVGGMRFVGNDLAEPGVVMAFADGSLGFGRVSIAHHRLVSLQFFTLSPAKVLSPAEALVALGQGLLLAIGARSWLLRAEAGVLRLGPLRLDGLRCAMALRPGEFLAGIDVEGERGAPHRLDTFRVDDGDGDELEVVPMIPSGERARLFASGMRFCFAPPAHAIFANGRGEIMVLDFRIVKSRPIIRLPEKEGVLRIAVFPGDPVILGVASLCDGGAAVSVRVYRIAPPVFGMSGPAEVPVEEFGAAWVPLGQRRPPALDVATVVISPPGEPALLLFLALGADVFCFRQPLRPGQLTLVAQLALPRADLRIVRAQNTRDGVWLWVADRTRSVALLMYDDNRRRIELTAEESGVRLISAIAGDQREDVPAIVAGDRAGNVCRFEYDVWRDHDADPRFLGARKRLKLAWNYFIGEAVTCVSCSEGRWRYAWYHTVAGAFGGFMALDGIPALEQRFRTSTAENLKLLRAVELALADHFFALTKCDQFAFRNTCFPAAGTIDLDLLEWFSRISPEKREEIAKQQNKKVEEIEIVISQMKAYFWQW